MLDKLSEPELLADATVPVPRVAFVAGQRVASGAELDSHKVRLNLTHRGS